MTRELRRLLIQGARLQQRLTLKRDESHYLERVLRLRPGARLAVVNGRGSLWSARLEAGGTVVLEQPADQPLEHSQPLPVLLELAMAVPRHDADAVWRMACELGADRLQPLVADRQARGARLVPERWHDIVKEASEQCERLWLPELAPARPASDWLGQATGGMRLLATTRRRLPALEAVLPTMPPSVIRLAVGPEGGWSEAELTAAESVGWQAVSLGPTILRTSTAAVAGLARLVAWRSERLAHHALGHGAKA